MTRRISDVAACCSSASERCRRASASSWVRASSCFLNSISELGPLLTRVLAFVPIERSLRPRVRLFAPLRDKVTPEPVRSTQALPATDIQNITRLCRWVRPFTAVPQTETDHPGEAHEGRYFGTRGNVYGRMCLASGTRLAIGKKAAYVS